MLSRFDYVEFTHYAHNLCTTFPSVSNNTADDKAAKKTPTNALSGKKRKKVVIMGVSDSSNSTDQMEAVFNSKVAFPLSLTHMLESVEKLGMAHVVCWMDNETAFSIKDVDAFLADVLPKFFK